MPEVNLETEKGVENCEEESLELNREYSKLVAEGHLLALLFDFERPALYSSLLLIS